MLKPRRGLLAALTLFMLSGVLTSTASASGPFWHVNGAKFTEGTRQIKLQLKGTAIIRAPGAVVIEVECKNSISEGATIEGSKETQGQGKGRLSFSSCTVLKPIENKCAVAEPIVTNPLKSYLANAATQTGIVNVFEPALGTTLLVYHFIENGKCPFKETLSKGTLVAEVIPSKLEEQEGLVAFPTTPITKIKHEGVEKTLTAETTLTAFYGARLASFPERFGAFET